MTCEAAVKAYEATQMMLAKAKAQMRNREAWQEFSGAFSG